MGKSRSEENRGKAGNKENIKVSHITVHKTRTGAMKRNNQENRNSYKRKIFQQK